MDPKDEQAFLQAALARDLLRPEEAQDALATAVAEARPVSVVLVERGLLSARSVEAVTHAMTSSPGLAPARPDAPPARLADYVLLRKLGQGGMGEVWLAREESLQREVALKLLSPGIASSPQASERFLREARSAAAVNHPNVITCHRVGEAGGRLYMALELVSGGDADALLARRGGRLSEREALLLARDCCRGLEAIEKKGLVHRDLKPANIFITDTGAAKLADLGLARAQGDDQRLTQTGAIVGTPAYMSPEQADGRPDLDIRSDIYALGASLYRMLVGEPPYVGGSSMNVLLQVMRDPVPDPRARRPDLSPATCALITKAMAKERDQRQASARELLADVEAALARLEGPPAPPPATAAPPPATAAPSASAPSASGPPRAALAGAAVLLVLLAGGGALLAVGRTPPPPTAAPVPATEPAPATEAGPATEPEAAPATEPEPAPAPEPEPAPAPEPEPEPATEPEPAPPPPERERWLPLRQTRFPPGETEEITGLASVEPGETEKGWGLYQLVDPVRRKLPLHARWELSGVQVDRYAEPSLFARQRGVVGQPGFFASFGVRSAPPAPDAFHLEETPGAALCVTLYFCPDGRVTGCVSAFVPGAPRDLTREQRIGEKIDFKGYDFGTPVVVDLDAGAERWTLAVTQGERRLASAGEPWSKRPQVRQALASSAHVWGDVGCFDTGLGRASVGLELVAPAH